MQVTHADAQVFQVIRQAFGHALGQRGHQHAAAFFRGTVDLPHQIVHLTRRGPKHDQRVNQPRGTDDLLHRIFAQPQLIGGRGGADIDGLVLPGAELLKQQRAVVIGAG